MSESHPNITPGQPPAPSPLHPDPDAPATDSSRRQDGDVREEVRTEVGAEGGAPEVLPDSDPARAQDDSHGDADTRDEVWREESPSAGEQA